MSIQRLLYFSDDAINVHVLKARVPEATLTFSRVRERKKCKNKISMNPEAVNFLLPGNFLFY